MERSPSSDLNQFQQAGLILSRVLLQQAYQRHARWSSPAHRDSGRASPAHNAKRRGWGWGRWTTRATSADVITILDETQGSTNVKCSNL